jgi:hypothetical protein
MRALALALVALAGPVGGNSGKVFLTVEEALALAFPGCEIERRTEYLSAAEAARVEALGRCELRARVVRPYVAKKDGRCVGTAYFDAHRVRTKNEVLMLVVEDDARLRRVEVLSFAEPLEYLPKAGFYAQFVGQGIDEERGLERLEVGRDIRGVSGATLSAETATAAARRALALQRVLGERGLAPGARTAAR